MVKEHPVRTNAMKAVPCLPPTAFLQLLAQAFDASLRRSRFRAFTVPRLLLFSVFAILSLVGISQGQTVFQQNANGGTYSYPTGTYDGNGDMIYETGAFPSNNNWSQIQQLDAYGNIIGRSNWNVLNGVQSGANVVVDGHSTTDDASYSILSLTISNGGGVAINTGVTLNVSGDVTVNSGTLSVSGNGNFNTVTNYGGTVSGGLGATTNILSTAGNSTFINNGPTVSGAGSGGTYFVGSGPFLGTASHGTFTNNGGTVSGASGGRISFTGTATADHGTFTNNGGTVSGAFGGLVFFTSGTASNSTITNNGGTVTGASGGMLLLGGNTTAGSSTLIANGGQNGGLGGQISFTGQADGATSTLKVYGNGTLDISGITTTGGAASPNLNIGSLAGNGVVSLGKNRLTVGSTFTQSSGGILNVQIGGTGSGQYGQIVAGTAVLSGSLNVTFLSNYIPPNNASFQILSTNSLSGTFNNGNPLIQIGTRFYAITYSNTGVTIQPTAVFTAYHEPPNGYLVGHVFVSTTSMGGLKQFYGFYPDGGSAIWGPGIVNDDQYTAWDFAIAYPITESQYLSAARAITQDLANPPIYFLAGLNCMAWAAKIALAAGIQLPPDTLPISNVYDESIFGGYIKTLGAGFVYQAGNSSGVVINNGFVFPQSVSTTTTATPYDYSYSLLESSGFANAATLATTLGLNYDAHNLGNVNANSVNGLTLNLVGTATTNALISVNWGDGSAYTEQSLTPSHFYAAGTYNAQVLIIDNGAVHSYTMTVGVSSSLSPPVTVNVTAFTPVNIPNQGLTPASPVPDFIVMQTTGFSVLANGHGLIQFNGIPGWTYSIQATPTLSQSFSTIGSATADTNGNFQFDDPGAIGATSRFYRATYP